MSEEIRRISINTSKPVAKPSRSNILDLYIGFNKSGKTTVAEQFARSWRSSRPRHHKIIAHDPTNRIQDIVDEDIDPENKDWALELKERRNVLVWIDEFRLLSEKNTAPAGLKSLLMGHKNWNMDIISIFHNPELVLNCFTYHNPRYYIFGTSAKEGSFDKKIPNSLLCVTAANEVNEYWRLHQSNDPNARFPYKKFPYIIVDVLTQKLQACHMEKRIRK